MQEPCTCFGTSARHSARRIGIDPLGCGFILFSLVDSGIGGCVDHDAGLDVFDGRSAMVWAGQIDLCAAQRCYIARGAQLGRDLPGFAKDQYAHPLALPVKRIVQIAQQWGITILIRQNGGGAIHRPVNPNLGVIKPDRAIAFWCVII